MVAVLLAMTNNLDAGSPAGRLYGESLANALAVYLLNRYTVRRYTPVVYKEDYPDIVSSVYLIILGTTWRKISA